jgi:hypothetical protein
MSTKSNTGSTTFVNVFKVTKTDDSWYIKTWTENSTIIFQNIVPKN